MFHYMAHGKTIISSDLPVLREILDESFARFATPDETLSWAYQIEALRDERLRQHLGEMAQKKQQEDFTWEKRALRLLDAIYPDG